MGPSVKHVLGVLEWSYVIPEKNIIFGSKMPLGLCFTIAALSTCIFVVELGEFS